MVELNPNVTCVTSPDAPGLILRLAGFIFPPCIQAEVDSQQWLGGTTIDSSLSYIFVTSCKKLLTASIN